ncbi:MAG: glycosyltransferase, partial [bacterium]
QAEDYAPEKFEIIIVDGGSTDGSREWLSTLEDSQFRVILQNEDRGRSALRNDGIRIAQNDIVIMLDGDHTIGKDFILAHAQRHAERECVVVGQSQFSRDWRTRALLRYLNTRGARKLPPGKPLPGRYFITRNCSVPKALLQRVGLFDETFTTWGGEDLELGVRLAKAKIEIVHEPRAQAWHHHYRPLKALLKNLERYGKESIPYLLKRHPELYRELNLHRLKSPWVRLLMTAAIYCPIRTVVGLLLPFYVPSVVFDYLHLRQYGRGFLRSQRGKSLCQRL